MKHNLWNLLSCLKNGLIVKKAKIKHTRTRLNENVLKVLWDEGYISGYKISDNDKNKIEIFLKYDGNSEPCIKTITSLSKPGKRLYYSYKQLWKISSTNTCLIISTNKGLKTIEDCKKLQLGGEPLFAVK